MRASNLNQRITLQQRVDGLDAAGQASTSWEDLADEPTVFAEVLPLRGRDLVAAAQAQATFDAKVTIRYRADVVATMRALWATNAGDVPLEIVGQPINVRGRGQWLELMCTHGVRAGA